MDFADVEPIAYVTRSGVVESVHHGVAFALESDGAPAFAVGTPGALVYPRSSLKPLQAAAMVELGLAARGEQLAVACGSHAGSPHHVAVVCELLASVGLDESALRNTPALPHDHTCAHAVIAAGGSARAVTQNCSGKHAAMLATCVANGWTTDDHLAVDHPLQRAITDWIDRHAGGVHHVGVDGCGAPTAMVGLDGFTRAVASLARDAGPVVAAMMEHPELVDGEVRADTLLMRAIPGLIVKGGAEAVGVAAYADGRAVAIKIADGYDRGRVTVLAAALRRLGFDTHDVASPPVLGHGEPVGEVTASWEWTGPDATVARIVKESLTIRATVDRGPG